MLERGGGEQEGDEQEGDEVAGLPFEEPVVGDLVGVAPEVGEQRRPLGGAQRAGGDVVQVVEHRDRRRAGDLLVRAERVAGVDADEAPRRGPLHPRAVPGLGGDIGVGVAGRATRLALGAPEHHHDLRPARGALRSEGAVGVGLDDPLGLGPAQGGGRGGNVGEAVGRSTDGAPARSRAPTAVSAAPPASNARRLTARVVRPAIPEVSTTPQAGLGLSAHAPVPMWSRPAFGDGAGAA